MGSREVWKDIDSYEGLYQVSNQGNVKSFHFNKGDTSRLLKNRLVNEGYCQVVLYNKGKKKAFYAHVLVANAFILNTNNLPEVNHIDGDKTNNCVENLEWVTSKQNSIHAVKTGLRDVPKGSQHYKSKKVYQYDRDGNLIKVWDSMNEITRILGYHHSNIYKCCRHHIPSAYGYVWRYAEEGWY